jgi:coenzyme F420-reducing hydrogenase gamma subunit
VWKFASCDGCQLSLLDCEDELLAVADGVEIALFPEASSRMLPGPYDVSLVEGSITTAHDRERIQDVRAQSGLLVTIGACATAGGIQALRNLRDVEEWKRIVYARPDWIDSLATSTPIAAHVKVDYELRGCPVSKHQLLELLAALLAGRRPNVATSSVCEECKAHNRGCYGCFGPKETPNPAALSEQLLAAGMDRAALGRFYRTFNAAAPAFGDEAERHDPSR